MDRDHGARSQELLDNGSFPRTLLPSFPNGSSPSNPAAPQQVCVGRGIVKVRRSRSHSESNEQDASPWQPKIQKTSSAKAKKPKAPTQRKKSLNRAPSHDSQSDDPSPTPFNPLDVLTSAINKPNFESEFPSSTATPPFSFSPPQPYIPDPSDFPFLSASSPEAFLSPPALPTLPESEFHSLPLEHQFFLLEIKETVLAFRQQPPNWTESERLSKILSKMNASFQTKEAQKIAKSVSQSIFPAATSPTPITATTSSTIQTRAHSQKRSSSATTKRSLSPSPTDLPAVGQTWAPQIDHRLYFSHCYNWLESVIRFSETEDMKEYLIKIMDTLCFHHCDGVMIRDKSFRTLWANQIFLDTLEYDSSEITQPTFTPVDYVHPSSLLLMREPMALALTGLREDPFFELSDMKFVTRKTKRIVLASQKLWFIRDRFGGLLFMIFAASYQNEF